MLNLAKISPNLTLTLLRFFPYSAFVLVFVFFSLCVCVCVYVYMYVCMCVYIYIYTSEFKTRNNMHGTIYNLHISMT